MIDISDSEVCTFLIVFLLVPYSELELVLCLCWERGARSVRRVTGTSPSRTLPRGTNLKLSNINVKTRYSNYICKIIIESECWKALVVHPCQILFSMLHADR